MRVYSNPTTCFNPGGGGGTPDTVPQAEFLDVIRTKVLFYVRVFAKFEILRRVRGKSRFRKQKTRRGRGLALVPRLDPSIPRSSNSLAPDRCTGTCSHLPSWQ